MVKSQKMVDAKKAKNDEFYTQYSDIQREINAYLEYNPNVFRDKTVLLPCDDPEWSNFTRFFAQNFEALGLKKLISTSYAYNSKNKEFRGVYQLSMFEDKRSEYSEEFSKKKGKIFILEKDNNSSGNIDIEDLEWHYLEGDGDFRSEEIKKLRHEADIIVTNPPFSLYRSFIEWLFEENKYFIIIGNIGSATYKEIFPYIMENKMWCGYGFNKGNAFFSVPKETDIKSYGEGVYDKKTGLVKFRNVGWFTNIEHGRRHELLPLMSLNDNIKYSKHKEIRGNGYKKYDNYDAIEVPYVDSIPNNWDGIMGVPASFLQKYNPEQFEILGCTQRGCHDKVKETKIYNDYWEVRQNGLKTGSTGGKTNGNPNLEQNDGIHNYYINKDGHVIQSANSRIFIRFRRNENEN